MRPVNLPPTLTRGSGGGESVFHAVWTTNGASPSLSILVRSGSAGAATLANTLRADAARKREKSVGGPAWDASSSRTPRYPCRDAENPTVSRWCVRLPSGVVSSPLP